MKKENNQWYQFYKDRINSTYQDYFNERYKVMIDIIKNSKINFILEEGCGIGSISKALPEIVSVCGYDISESMVKLSRLNNPRRGFYVDNIFSPKVYNPTELVVTHGVLEHFTDNQIKIIFNRYNKTKQKSIHYIPLEDYKVPSFGDERLLSHNHWLNLTKPKDYIIFNNGCDLLLINT